MKQPRRMISIEAATHDSLRKALIRYVAETRTMVSLTAFTTHVIHVGLAALEKKDQHLPRA